MSQSLDDLIANANNNSSSESKDSDLNNLFSSLNEAGNGFVTNIYDIAMGANKTYYMGEFKGKRVSLRLLTCQEERDLCTLIPMHIVNSKYKDYEQNVKDFNLLWFGNLVKIIIASTPSPINGSNMSLNKQFSLLHANAAIKYKDLENLSRVSYANLLTQVQQLENKCNPTIDKMPDKDVEELLKQIKKRQIRTWDLHWNQLCQILDHVILSESPEVSASSPT